MADDLRERKRERRKRRKKLQRTQLRRKSDHGSSAPGTHQPLEGKETTEEKQQDKKIREQDITGLKYFDKLKPLLERLHEVGCERDKAGNRELHFDHYCMLIPALLVQSHCDLATNLRPVPRHPASQRTRQSSEKARLPAGFSRFTLRSGQRRGVAGPLGEAQAAGQGVVDKKLIGVARPRSCPAARVA